MAANELNLDITFEQSAFSKIYRSKTFEVWCRFGYHGGLTVEVNTGAARAVTDRHTHTNRLP